LWPLIDPLPGGLMWWPGSDSWSAHQYTVLLQQTNVRIVDIFFSKFISFLAFPNLYSTTVTGKYIFVHGIFSRHTPSPIHFCLVIDAVMYGYNEPSGPTKELLPVLVTISIILYSTFYFHTLFFMILLNKLATFAI
jgi:hypothetical protein